jgi:hypothetical protein
VNFRTRLAGAAAALMIAAAAALTTATPAQAASQYVGVPGAEDRCRTHPTALVCFYYRYWHEAFWGSAYSDSTLQDNYYWAGTGAGAGQRVRNNSRKMHCDYWVPNYCESFVYPGYGGNDDWMYYGQVGELAYTWNNNASVRLS